jgi:hypothetical protein
MLIFEIGTVVFWGCSPEHSFVLAPARCESRSPPPARRKRAKNAGSAKQGPLPGKCTEPAAQLSPSPPSETLDQALGFGCLRAPRLLSLADRRLANRSPRIQQPRRASSRQPSRGASRWQGLDHLVMPRLHRMISIDSLRTCEFYYGHVALQHGLSLACPAISAKTFAVRGSGLA